VESVKFADYDVVIVVDLMLLMTDYDVVNGTF